MTFDELYKRIADARPDYATESDIYCFFCGEWFVESVDAVKPEKHEPDCLWRQAVEYVEDLTINGNPDAPKPRGLLTKRGGGTPPSHPNDVRQMILTMQKAPVPPTIATDDSFREVYGQGYRHALNDVLAALPLPAGETPGS